MIIGGWRAGGVEGNIKNQTDRIDGSCAVKIISYQIKEEKLPKITEHL